MTHAIRTALATVLLLAAAACADAGASCSSIGGGAFSASGRGVGLMPRAVSNGQRASAAAGGCDDLLPGLGSTLTHYYNAQNPGAGNAPNDLGTAAAGLMSVVGDAAYNASGGPGGTTAAWDFDGTGDHYTETGATSLTPPYTVWCLADDDLNGSADKSPCGSATGPRHYAANALRGTVGATATNPLLSVTDASAFGLYAFTITTAGGSDDTLYFNNSTETNSASGAGSDANSGTSIIMSGEPGQLLDWQGSVAAMGVDDAATDMGALLTWAQCEFGL